jgi:hypothetical protein
MQSEFLIMYKYGQSKFYKHFVPKGTIIIYTVLFFFINIPPLRRLDFQLRNLNPDRDLIFIETRIYNSNKNPIGMIYLYFKLEYAKYSVPKGTIIICPRLFVL